MASSFLTVPITTSPSTHRRSTISNKPPVRFSVSCSSQFDRRDMLLGIGGLYGAANFITGNSPATAAPVQAPSLDKCSKATDLNDSAEVAFNCCISKKEMKPPKPYKMPSPPAKLRERPALHSADEKYFDQYRSAVRAMKKLSIDDPDDPRGFLQQANVHCAYCNFAYPQAPMSDLKLQIHFSWLFLPWHRWYLYFYERILGKLIGDESFALPFWNWDNPPGMVMPKQFTNQSSPLFDELRNTQHYPPAITDLRFGEDGDTGQRIIQNNLAEMHNEMITNGSTLEGFYGGKYIVGTDLEKYVGDFPDLTHLQGSLEGGSHTAVHIWTGEDTTKAFDMGNFSTAGRDPLFFCHHANIDRLWSVWLDIQDKNHRNKFFTERDWKDATFVFYDEEGDPVTVRVGDALDNEKMGFTWQKVGNPWEKLPPRAMKKRSKIAHTSNAPKSWEANFPVKLDKVFRVLVDRPKKNRSTKEKLEKREMLEISGIDVESTKYVRFEVFINDEDDIDHEDLVASAAYAGGYSQIPMRHGMMKSALRLDLTDLLQELDVEDDDKILITVVPKAGGECISIGGIKIVFAS